MSMGELSRTLTSVLTLSLDSNPHFFTSLNPSLCALIPFIFIAAVFVLEIMDSNITVSQSFTVNLYSQIIHILVTIFLCVDLLLIATFFQKHYFYTTTRYILFALMMFADFVGLLISYLLMLLTNSMIPFQVWTCIIVSGTLLTYVFVSPVTLTAMTLERYVAVCFPLRHAELCSTPNTVRSILIIHVISVVPGLVILGTFFVSAPTGFYSQSKTCSVEIFILHKWQQHVRSAIQLFYFLIMISVILFCYVEIVKVVKTASGENKKFSQKGLRTVTLQAFQLLLCLIRLWCPFVEVAVLQLDVRMFIKVRYFDYVTFILAPKFLSPLIYGLRDEMFFKALKQLVFRGLCETKR